MTLLIFLSRVLTIRVKYLGAYQLKTVTIVENYRDKVKREKKKKYIKLPMLCNPSKIRVTFASILIL